VSPSGLLRGKTALVVGVASERSLAWAIAQALAREGAELAFSYQGERLGERVRALAAEMGSSLVAPCDVSRDEDIDALARAVGERWERLDMLVHAVAFAPREALAAGFTEATDREAFRVAHDVSAYSLVGLVRAFRPLLAKAQGSVVTLSYLGAERALPNYNVMGPAKASLEASVRFLAFDLGPQGIRVNAVSAGPVKTLAAAGIPGFRRMLDHVQRTAPLRRSVTAEEVANAALFLLSGLSSGVTGETLYVDSGYHIVGMAFGDAPSENA
jgi:enoyl-[acyl-carrier protein] reductase I